MTNHFLKYAPWLREHKKLLFIVFPILPLFTAFLLYYHSPVNFIQKNTEGPVIYTIYNDRLNGGNSISREIPDNKGIILNYTLKDGILYPFSGIALFDKEGNHFDLSPFDYVKIRIRASKGKRFPFILSTHIENYTKPDDYNTLRNNQSIINVSNEFKEIQVNMRDLETPEWWYTQNKIAENSLGLPDYSKVKSLSISSCLALEKNEEDTVEIQEISFHVSLLPFFLYSFAFVLVYFSTGIFLTRKKKKNATEINFLYKKTETVNYLEKTEEAIFEFLTSNYHHDHLTIVEVQNATGIHEQKISSLIRKRTGKNFKQFLNKLRISEAKRLLKESDLQISEIAFKVGYSNVSHFNRVFKDQENCSPNDFRKQELSAKIN